MEALSQALRPYMDIIGPAATYITILQFFAGAFICKDIYHKGSTKGASSLPFIGGIVIGILVLKFALLLQDQNMFNVNVMAIILNSIYLGFYITYAHDKFKEVILPSMKGATLVAALLLYVAFEDKEQVEFRYSFIVTALQLFLMGSPLMEIKTIIDKKDTSSIPFPLTFMGLIVSILWLLYGIVIMNHFMVVQNILGTTLCAIQLTLIAIYPADKSKDKKKKLKSKKKD